MSTSISATEIGLPDNAKIKLGTGEDLEIYHNGSHTFIDNNTGDLNLESSNVYIKANNTENAVSCLANGAVELYYDNSKVLETMTQGVRITDNFLEINDTSCHLDFMENGSSNNHRLRQNAGNLYIQKLSDDKNTSTTAILVDGGNEAVELYQGGNKKLETISTGLNVTGGVRLGGNNSANEIDDYETGSWTPVVGGWDTFSPYSGSSYYAGWYVKVGKLIHVGWKIYIQNLTTPATSGSQHIRITGLPFASNSITSGPVAHVRFDIPEFGTGGEFLSYLGGNGTIIYMYNHASGANHLTAINAAASRSNVWTMGTATYYTS